MVVVIENLIDTTPDMLCFPPAGGGEWRVLDGVVGDIPPPRTHHTSTCMWREKLVVFSGGSSGTDTLDNSVYIFDIGIYIILY